MSLTDACYRVLVHTLFLPFRLGAAAGLGLDGANVNVAGGVGQFQNYGKLPSKWYPVAPAKASRNIAGGLGVQLGPLG